MFVRHKYSGQVLFVVLTIVFLLSLFLQYMVQSVVLEYQRVGNNILEYKLLQDLQAQVYEEVQRLLSKADVRAEKTAGFIPDTLELNCQTGITIFKFAAAKALPLQLAVPAQLAVPTQLAVPAQLVAVPTQLVAVPTQLLISYSVRQ